MLPVIDLPTYDIKVPSTGKTIKIRPFKVKEEKLLLMAAESNDSQEIINTTKQILKNCILTEDIDIEKLPFFDIDYIFIALRAKSVGESIDIKFTCNNLVDNYTCGNIFPAKIDITNCKIVKNESLNSRIELDSSVTVGMKYPTYAEMKTITDSKKAIDVEMNIIASCIDTIMKKDTVYTRKDMTKEEILAFIDNLSQEQYRKLEYYIENFPTFVITTEAVCDKCGFHHHLEYKEFESFFV